MAYGVGGYGIIRFGEDITSHSDIDPHIPDLLVYLPWFYQNNITMRGLQDSAAEELGVLYYQIADFIKQLFIDTATWGLSICEGELGLPINLSQSYEERREIIKAKLWGRGTTTKQMIKDTAEAFSGGEVNVIEYPEEYRIVIQFVGIRGIPRNMQGFIDMLETIKPAHIAYDFIYTYTVWDSLSELTWDDVDTKTWDELKVYSEE